MASTYTESLYLLFNYVNQFFNIQKVARQQNSFSTQPNPRESTTTTPSQKTTFFSKACPSTSPAFIFTLETVKAIKPTTKSTPTTISPCTTPTLALTYSRSPFQRIRAVSAERNGQPCTTRREGWLESWKVACPWWNSAWRQSNGTWRFLPSKKRRVIFNHLLAEREPSHTRYRRQ